MKFALLSLLPLLLVQVNAAPAPQEGGLPIVGGLPVLGGLFGDLPLASGIPVDGLKVRNAAPEPQDSGLLPSGLLASLLGGGLKRDEPQCGGSSGGGEGGVGVSVSASIYAPSTPAWSDPASTSTSTWAPTSSSAWVPTSSSTWTPTWTSSPSSTPSSGTPTSSSSEGHSSSSSGSGSGSASGSKPPATTTITVTGAAPSSTGTTCSTGPVQCCDSVEPSNSANVASIAALLGLVLQGTNVPVGLNCVPISVIGLGSAGTCNAQTVCCENDQFNGLINIGCTPINIGL